VFNLGSKSATCWELLQVSLSLWCKLLVEFKKERNGGKKEFSWEEQVCPSKFVFMKKGHDAQNAAIC